MVGVVVVRGVRDHEIGRGLGDEAAERRDQRGVGHQRTVREVEEARGGAERRRGRLGLGTAQAAQRLGRLLTAGRAVGGDGQDELRPHRLPGVERAAEEDLEVVRMGAEREDPHARSRNSSTIAAVQVKLPPPSGSPLCGS